MTTYLKTPAVCSVQLVATVVEDRQRGRNRAYFTSIESDWKQKISEYILHCGNPERIDPWPVAATRTTTFVTLYESSNSNHRHVKVIDDLRDRTLDYCPACGEDGTPNTLDHYLPKTLYPEYAITPLNLFPMCDICQGHKEVKTKDAAGKRIFLHPYFDAFLVQRVLGLQIEPPYQTPAFTLKALSGLDPAESELVERHVAHLLMHDRYGEFVQKAYVRLLRLCADAREVGLAIPTQLELWRRNAERKAVNGWDHILYASAQSNSDLLEYLADGELPSHL